MNREISIQRAYLKAENKKYSSTMSYVQEPWPEQKGCKVVGVWRSKDYLCQLVIEDRTGAMRMSVQRTMIDERGGWVEGIAWEEMMRIKREIGLGHALALEVYPRDKDIVNIANMRHLFFTAPDFFIGWEAR